MYTTIEDVFASPIWTVQDQKYWNTMVTKYRYPVTRVQELYRFIIENNKIDTFEVEYVEYQASLNA